MRKIAVCLIFFAGCSFHPARRVPVGDIPVTLREDRLLTVLDAKVYEDRGVLCVEGVVVSSRGEHADQRGVVRVTAVGEDGLVLERRCGAFGSTVKRDGSHLRREHTHSDRRFDVSLGAPVAAVRNVVIEPIPDGRVCHID